MQSVFAFIISIFLIVGYFLIFPLDALRLLRLLKGKFRHYLIRRHGALAFQEIATAFRKQASKKGYSKNLVERVLHEAQDAIIQQRGTAYTDEFLGQPEWYE